MTCGARGLHYPIMGWLMGALRMLRAIVIALLVALLPSHARAQERIALLIGNQGYTDKVGPLKNPHHDIAIVGKALETDGFKVTTFRDAGRRQVFSAVQAFAAELAKAGANAVGFLYYSGHGVSRPEDRANYLIPVDLKDTETSDFWFDAVKLDDLLGELERAAPFAAHFVVFDACRNELKLPGRTIAKGLEPVAQRNGMFIAFATAVGATASDGGEYAEAMAKELVKPGQDHLQFFQNVREDVYAATRRQVPWDSNGLLRRVYFGGELKAAERDWQQYGKDTKDIRLLEAFNEKHKADPLYARLAEARIEELKREEDKRAEAERREALLSPSIETPEKKASGDQLDTLVGKAKADYLREQHSVITKERTDRNLAQVPECNSTLLPVKATALGSRFSCLLMDHKSGAALMATKPDATRSTSSLAKIMTLYITFKKLKQGELSLSDNVLISQSAAAVPPSKLGAPAGASLTVQEAIEAIVVKSANDVAFALAEHIGGSEVGFVAQMNKFAGDLSMHATKFTNSTGLPDPAQISSAVDLAILANAIIGDTGQYYHFFSTKTFAFRGKSFRNQDPLPFEEIGLDGLKSAFTAEAGYNYLFSAERDGNRVVGVILGMESGASRNAFIRLIMDEAFQSVKKGGTRVNYKIFAR
jgi:D-alanyl-D-alanine carboxypeptidase